MNAHDGGTATAAQGLAVDWYRDLGEIIEALGSEALPERLVRGLAHLVPFELAAVFAYRGRSRPLVIYDNFDLCGARGGITAYIESTYVLNPFYHAHLRGLDDGVYRMRDLAPDAFYESEYYRAYKARPSPAEEIGYVTENWPPGMEELMIATTLEDGVLAEISLSRPHKGGGFDDADVARLSAVAPVIDALLRNYWVEFGAAGLRASPTDSRVDDAFANFGKSVLTDRECEVTQLILRGHSSASICGNLGISLGTVKTHRKNAYAKLAISSQSELLARFLQSLKAA